MSFSNRNKSHVLQPKKSCNNYLNMQVYYLYKDVLIAFLCCIIFIIRSISVKRKNGVMVYLLFLFYLTKMHVQALCKQIVSDASVHRLPLD